jgi:hypothetical protein
MISTKEDGGGMEGREGWWWCCVVGGVITMADVGFFWKASDSL